MYAQLFNDVFEDNINKICIFEMGAFYVIVNRQAVYVAELLGLKKVCFAAMVCKVGFPKNSLNKYMKKLRDLGINFVVLDACDMDIESDYSYMGRGFKKRYEFVDERFVFNKENYECDCNKCAFKKTDIMKDLDNCYRMVANLASKISNLALIQDMDIPCKISTDAEVYEEITLWGKTNYED